MLNLCSDGHDEICFEVRNCPCCEIIKEKDRVIEELEEDLKSREGEMKPEGSIRDWEKGAK